MRGWGTAVNSLRPPLARSRQAPVLGPFGTGELGTKKEGLHDYHLLWGPEGRGVQGGRGTLGALGKLGEPWGSWGSLGEAGGALGNNREYCES